VRVLRVLAPGARRGPSAEARALFEDLSPPPAPSASDAARAPGAGRPTKRDRRAIAALKRGLADDFSDSAD
jgi:ribosome-associated heat shock protein Hsp15